MSDPVPEVALKRHRWGTMLAIITATGCVIGGVLLLVLSSPTSALPTTQLTTGITVPLSTPSLHSTESATPLASPMTTMHPLPLKAVIPLAAEPRRLQIPSAGIDINVVELPEQSVVGTRLIPPEESAFAYWVSQFNFGLAGEGSTDKVVIVAHSGDDSQWVFNRLSDPKLVAIGDHIIVTTDVGKLTYAVKVVDHQTRFETGSSSYIKESHPDDLMLISCFTADLYNQNRIVVATLVR